MALAARVLGCTATICMPTNTPQIKIDAVNELGGIVQLVGESFFEAQEVAQARAAAEGQTFVPGAALQWAVAGSLAQQARCTRCLASPSCCALVTPP